MRIFNKATTPPPKPTPAAVAAGVHKSTELRLAEIELKRLREKRGSILARAVAIINGQPIDGESPAQLEHRRRAAVNVAEVNRLEAERLTAEEQICATRVALQPLRQAHAEALGAALGPTVNAEARRALAAIAELRDAVRIIAEARDIIALYGIEIERPLLPDLGRLEALMHRRSGDAAPIAEAAE